MDKAASAVSYIAIAIVLGVGIAFGRGDLENIPWHAVPQVVLGGIAGFLAVLGTGYVLCKAWDYLIARVRRR